APGLDPKAIDLSIQQNLLTVAGTRRLPEGDAASYYRQERFGGEFRRVIALPDDVEADQAQTRYRDGILHITVHRKEATKPRQIEVNVA
ncbi:MAG: Hsp20/alpha crystallin family protein, partial [Gammaproteobacteria bacterium]